MISLLMRYLMLSISILTTFHLSSAVKECHAQVDPRPSVLDGIADESLVKLEYYVQNITYLDDRHLLVMPYEGEPDLQVFSLPEFRHVKKLKLPDQTVRQFCLPIEKSICIASLNLDLQGKVESSTIHYFEADSLKQITTVDVPGEVISMANLKQSAGVIGVSLLANGLNLLFEIDRNKKYSEIREYQGNPKVLRPNLANDKILLSMRNERLASFDMISILKLDVNQIETVGKLYSVNLQYEWIANEKFLRLNGVPQLFTLDPNDKSQFTARFDRFVFKNLRSGFKNPELFAGLGSGATQRR